MEKSNRLIFFVFFIFLLFYCSKSIALELEITIHPQSTDFDCSKKYPDKETDGVKNNELNREPYFSELLRNGSLSLVKSDFDSNREFYPCLQTYKIKIKDKKALCEYVKQLGCCPEYPWYSGADFALYEAIIQYAADTGDQCLYKALLLKDTKLSASELNGPLYSRLRKNLIAFLTAFSSLSENQKEVVLSTQWEINVSFESRLIDLKSPELEDRKDLFDVAKEYNFLRKKEHRSENNK